MRQKRDHVSWIYVSTAPTCGTEHRPLLCRIWLYWGVSFLLPLWPSLHACLAHCDLREKTLFPLGKLSLIFTSFLCLCTKNCATTAYWFMVISHDRSVIEWNDTLIMCS